jgi:hypothetical protein
MYWKSKHQLSRITIFIPRANHEQLMKHPDNVQNFRCPLAGAKASFVAYTAASIATG